MSAFSSHRNYIAEKAAGGGPYVANYSGLRDEQVQTCCPFYDVQSCHPTMK